MVNIRVANACTNPDLLLGAERRRRGVRELVTRLTLRTHELPNFVGAVFATVQGLVRGRLSSACGQRRSTSIASSFSMSIGASSFASSQAMSSTFFMVFQWTSIKSQAEANVASVLRLDRFRAAGLSGDPRRRRHLGCLAGSFGTWRSSVKLPGIVVADDRPGAPEGNILWAGDQGEAGWTIYAYQSAWLPASLLEADKRDRLVDALVSATKHAPVHLHVNKGLAGARPEAIAAAGETAMNPAVTEAFALAISGSGGAPSYPGVPGHEPDEAAARTRAAAVTIAMDGIRKLLPRPASYVWETDFFEPDWQEAFWGGNFRGFARSRPNTTRTASSSITTVSVAKTGAPMALRE